MIDLTFNNLTKKKYPKSFFSKTIAAAVELARLQNRDIGLSINIVGKNKSRALNKKYRFQDKPTDVLSFPVNLRQGVVRPRAVNAILELGDIFICPQIAGRERIELSRLTVHGFLHLLGYDHKKPLEKKKMQKLENRILSVVSEF